MSETRKLAAILVADVVGYSRLAGADEDRTLARLRGLRSDLIDPAIAAHHGRVVKRTGDGSIIEFRSVVDAVRCAIEVQTGLIERNGGLPSEKRIEFRIGIHLGDVVEESDGDLMGDGVNVAARLEGIAKPGAICLSEQAYWQVKSRLDLKISDLGATQLKNIAEPVRVYSLEVGQPSESQPASAATVAVKRKSGTPAPGSSGWGLRWSALAAALALVLLAAGAYGWRSGLAPRLLGASVAEDKLKTAPRMSIVVLPFANLSGDPEQEYFADGITDYLTTDLSRIPESFVIAHNTALTYKGKPVDAKSIGRELGVRYLLEGSVRRVGETVTVNAQLISTETSAHVWADRFEGQMSNLGLLQFDVVARLSRSLGIELFQAENLRAMRERPDSPDAVDLTLRGMAMMRSMQRSGNFNKTTFNDQIRLYDRALALDPHYELAMLMLAATLGVRNNPEAYDLAGSFKMHLGRSTEGVGDIETAFRISPHDFLSPAFQVDLCRLRAHLAQWDKAISECEKAVAARPWDTRATGPLAAAYAWAGRDKEAKGAVAKLRKADPYFTLAEVAGLGESDDPTYKEEAARIIEGLRKARAADERSALAEAEKAIADDPTNATAYADAGLYKMFLGRSADGVTDVETALRLGPHDKDAPEWQSRLCDLRGHLAQWEQAIEQCEEAVAGALPGDWGPIGYLAAAYAFAGRDFQVIIDSHDNPTYKAENARAMEGLRKAGVPEE